MKKILITFLTTLFLSYFLLEACFRSLKIRHERHDDTQSKIILESVKDRFKLFLELPFTIGLMGSDYFSTLNVDEAEYAKLAKKFLKYNDDLLGLSLVNEKGEIIGVYPPKTNPSTKGRVTQNLRFLNESFSRDESFWFSPPFKLYQGQQGFVFYVPIYSGGKHKGWFAPVISASQFSKKLKLTEITKTYNIIIKDKNSELNYFASGMEIGNEDRIHQTTTRVFGRDLIFKTWRKEPLETHQPPLQGKLFISIIISLFAVLIAKLHFQKKKARAQLNDIGLLLKMTSREALNKLIDLQSQFYKMESSQNIIYLTNLIEQIDLLQTMAETREGINSTRHQFLPILLEEIENLSETISKKNLRIEFSKAHFTEVEIMTNAWLMQNTILRNVLTHSIIHADAGTAILIEYSKNDDSHFITFRTENIGWKSMEGVQIKIDRRIDVARKALQIYQGDLFLQQDLSGGMIIRIIMPV